MLLVTANGALLAGDPEVAIDAITGLAERVFSFYPFKPNRRLPENWRELLRCWLLGESVAELASGQEPETLQFIEGGLVYRLSWAMEAVRVRAEANGDVVGDDGLTLDDYELGLAVSAVETGTMHPSASILIQAGFTSRLAAIKAVADTGATFTTGDELRSWLNSDTVIALSARPDWPTAETKAMWTKLAQSFMQRDFRTWRKRRHIFGVAWSEVPPPPGIPVQLHQSNGRSHVLAADGLPLGTLQGAVNPNRRGLIRAVVAPDGQTIDLAYLGPNDLVLE